MRKLIILSSLALALSSVTPSAHAAVVYRPGEGWVSEEADAGETEKTASEQLHKAEALEKSGDYKKAISAYRTLLRQFPDSGAGPQAQFKIAQLDEAIHELDRAFEAYGKYITHYPRGADFDNAVEAQFNIAKAFLNGEKRKLFGVKTFASMERAQQMFEAVIKNAPYSKFAALAQFNVGRALEKQGKFPEAIAAYQTTVDKYPADDIAGDAQYQIGYLYMKQSKDGSHDFGIRVKAREAFEDFVMRYPQSEKVAQARQNIAALTGTDTKGALAVGQFYEKKGSYKAAAVYYEDVIKNAPGSPEAEQAQKRLTKLKGSVGESALQAGTEHAQTGATAEEHRKLQAQVETAARPDYAGPPAPSAPEPQSQSKPQTTQKNQTSGTAPSQDAGTSFQASPLLQPAPAPAPSLPSQ